MRRLGCRAGRVCNIAADDSRFLGGDIISSKKNQIGEKKSGQQEALATHSTHHALYTMEHTREVVLWRWMLLGLRA